MTGIEILNRYFHIHEYKLFMKNINDRFDGDNEAKMRHLNGTYHSPKYFIMCSFSFDECPQPREYWTNLIIRIHEVYTEEQRTWDEPKKQLTKFKL